MDNSKSTLCSVCGFVGDLSRSRSVINKDLVDTWNLDKQLTEKFNARESCDCPNCGNSARTRALASAMLKQFPQRHATTLHEWVTRANTKNISVAEINSCGKLHSSLSKLKRLKYSEYVAKDNWLMRLKHWTKGISNQDFSSLKYADSSFDLVLHSEVIEHVNDPQKALDECRRILKSGGICLFTTPLIMSRVTRRRAEIVGGETKHLYPPSFHGSGEKDNLVFWEFGKDILKPWKVKIVFQDEDKELFVLQIDKSV